MAGLQMAKRAKMHQDDKDLRNIRQSYYLSHFFAYKFTQIVLVLPLFTHIV